MIVSIHIPKTGGRSFQRRLQSTYASRCLIDYGDWIGVDTPEALARNSARKAEMRKRGDRLSSAYDVIHGHFAADKYLGLFPTAFAAFFRDPYQQTVSHYQYFLRNPDIDHPAVKAFHKARMSVADFAAAFPNMQSRFLGGLTVEALAMVGLFEQYDRGVALFEAVFGCKLSPETSRENVNPNRGDAYEIDETVRKVVDIHRAADIDLYRRARERFDGLCARYGV